MLGYRRLREPHTRNDVADRPFLTIVEKADDLSTPRLPDCVEDIGSGCCSGHAQTIFQYRNICQEKRSLFVVGNAPRSTPGTPPPYKCIFGLFLSAKTCPVSSMSWLAQAQWRGFFSRNKTFRLQI